MNLTQQLEDKKKEKEKMEEYYIYPYHMEQDKEALEKYNKLCFEIAILEQAIAEKNELELQNEILRSSLKNAVKTIEKLEEDIQSHIYRGNSSKEKDNQRVPISESATDELNNESKAHSQLLLQKQRQEEIEFLKSLPTQSGKSSIYTRNRIKQRIEQLNQPKAEQDEK